MQIGSLKLKYCKYGWMLSSGPYIGKCFDLYGQYSESEVSMMRAFLREGSTVIDVGANIGDLTVPLARAVGEAGRVYAIESHPENFNVLCATQRR
jgi:2-polyprenyl-3-methyl-5-hydroxy-6-metoxy-1,4-benzoquinol methylase